MKIAIVGCGALGSYYGAMLCRAGQEVHFLLRSDYEVVRRNGVFIHSPAGDFHARRSTVSDSCHREIDGSAEEASLTSIMHLPVWMN